MAWIGEERLRHFEGRRSVAEIHPVPGQPFVVVGVVENLVGQEAVFQHVGMVDPGRCLLVPCCVLVAMQVRVDMSRHVPHVGGGRGGETEFRRGVDGSLCLALVPKVDAVVVCGVHRRFGEYLLDEGVHRLMAADWNLRWLVSELPDPACEEGLGLDVIREIVNDVLEIADHLLPPRFFVRGFTIEIVCLGGNVSLGMGACVFCKILGLFDEALRPFRVLPVGHGHAPIRHRASGILGCDLPERPFRLIIPEPVQLPQPLVKISLPLVPCGLDGDRDLTRSTDEPVGLPRSLVEGIALMRVTGLQDSFLRIKAGNGETEGGQGTRNME